MCVWGKKNVSLVSYHDCLSICVCVCCIKILNFGGSLLKSHSFPWSCKKTSLIKNLPMNIQVRDSLTLSLGFHFEHCYWERRCDQFSFSWMCDCRRPVIPHRTARLFASASHQRHNWGLLSLGKHCIYINPLLPPRNSNDSRLGKAGLLQALPSCLSRRKQGWKSQMQTSSWLWAPLVVSWRQCRGI